MVSTDQPDAARPLADNLVTLAGIAEDEPAAEFLLNAIAQLTVDRIAAVSYASVTSTRDGAFVTVAASGQVARAVDAAQYEAAEGPCVEAFRQQAPMVAVPDTTTTIRWPGFAEVARRYGLVATMSAPLYVGSGACTAVLNLHGRDMHTMAPLIYGIWSIYRPHERMGVPTEHLPPLDPGGRELLAGLSQALAVRDVIQNAIQLVRARVGCTADEAYTRLVQRARATGVSLALTAARELISGP